MASLSEMSLMCRLCLLEDQKQVNIPIFEDRSDKLLVKISGLLPIKISEEDRLPKRICNGCSNKLDLFYDFRNAALDSEQTLLSWLKDDNLIINALAETAVKEKVEIKEDTSYSDLAQFSFFDEEAEEPPAKRPRRFAAIESPISIASDSDNVHDQDEFDTIENLKYESDNDEDIAKSENESYNDLPVPENSAYDQPGPSDLGRSGAETPFMIENDCPTDDIKNEIEVSTIELIDPSKEIDGKKCSSVANSSFPDVIRKFQCYSCNAVFKTETSLKYHSLTHSDIRLFECDTCKAKFKQKSGLKSHISSHLEVYPFQCDICEAKFKRKGNLKTHTVKHSDIQPFECDTCKAKFKRKENLKNHILTHTNIHSFECNICKVKFKQKGNLKTHLSTHLDIYPFECDTCNVKFKRKYYLKSHIITHHSDIHPFECNTCKAKFKRKSDLNSHKLTHSDIYPFECGTCQAKFKRKRNLKHHMLIHLGIFPFACDTCKAKFKQKGNLKRHILRHSDEKNFKCNICNGKFKTKANLKQHSDRCKF